MIGHVGTKVGALVDGQLPAAEAERLWAHVHRCPSCRCEVEREGWVKTQLAGLAMNTPGRPAPAHLRGSLVAVSWCETELSSVSHQRRVVATAVLGAGSVGAAMVGVFALAVPAEAPGGDRRLPTTSLTTPSGSPSRATPSSSTVSNTPSRPARVGPVSQRWVTITP